GRSRALQSRLSLEYGQLDCLWKFNSYRLAVVELYSDLQIGNQVIDGIAENVPSQMKLLVILGVHEIVSVAIVIEIFHLGFIHVDFFDGIRGAESMLEHGAGTQVAQ